MTQPRGTSREGREVHLPSGSLPFRGRSGRSPPWDGDQEGGGPPTTATKSPKSHTRTPGGSTTGSPGCSGGSAMRSGQGEDELAGAPPATTSSPHEEAARIPARAKEGAANPGPISNRSAPVHGRRGREGANRAREMPWRGVASRRALCRSAPSLPAKKKRSAPSLPPDGRLGLITPMPLIFIGAYGPATRIRG
jgi:hypothetical protein